MNTVKTLPLKGTPAWCRYHVNKANEEMVKKGEFMTIIDAFWYEPCQGLKVGDHCDHDLFYNSMCQGKVKPRRYQPKEEETEPFYVINDCVKPNVLYKHHKGTCQYIVLDATNKSYFVEGRYALLKWQQVKTQETKSPKTQGPSVEEVD